MIDGKYVDDNCCNVFGCKDQIKKGIEERDVIIAHLKDKLDTIYQMVDDPIIFDRNFYSREDVDRLNDTMNELLEFLQEDDLR